MPSAFDAARAITTKRRASARLFPLPIKHQTSYIKHGPMDPFSYLSVLISIILALGMTRVLAGVGEMLQARSRRRLYWVHAVESVFVFGGGMVDFLSLAQSAALDIFPFYLCPDFTHHLVLGLDRSLSARVFFG